MNEKGFNSPVFRRIITIVLLAGVSITFLAVYYLVYLPQQRALYNARTFRVLHEIAVNFQQRVGNYGIVKTYSYVSDKWKDPIVPLKTLSLIKNFNHTDTSSAVTGNKKEFNSIFRKTFGKSISKIDFFNASVSLKSDSVYYAITLKKQPKTKASTSFDTISKQPVSIILNPLTEVHSGTFETIFLIKQTIDSVNNNRHILRYDSVVYRSPESDIDIANINTDSLFADKNFQVPVVRNVIIEDIPYKIFLLPFNMPDNPTFVLAGIMQQSTYNEQVQNIPINFLLTILFILVAILLALPFLKIFLLSKEESLRLPDVRAIISVIFIFPFFLVLFCAGVWLYGYHNGFVEKVLSAMQNNISSNFYKEIAQRIQQEKIYDSIITNPSSVIDSTLYKKIVSSLADSLKISHDTATDLKSIIFHPSAYNNLTSLHWMDEKGKDIAVWNFTKSPANATYFNVADRDYFKDIKYGRVSVLPIKTKDSFAIEPILSRLTGEYTISVATKSGIRIKGKIAKAIGISGKMYSVYNTVVPNGFSFLMIDSTGKVVCHSDTARNLQENIFKESQNNYALRNAINHKDSVVLDNVILYERGVKMIVKPLAGLPYYLITYYQQRGENLFIFHIISFAFVCEVVLLLFTSLFSYFIMLSDKSVTRLLFEPAKLNWLYPSPDKKNYYVKNAICFLAELILIYFFSLFYDKDSYHLFKLNAAILLPLFAVTGYYLIKNSKTFIEKNKIKGNFFFTKAHLKFLLASKNILLLYTISCIVFYSFQNIFFYNDVCAEEANVKTGIWIIIILMPLIASTIAAINKEIKQAPDYLKCFITSLILAVVLISVAPVLTMVNYGFREETKLQLQSLQIDLARKIQQRRQYANTRFWQTKINTSIFNDACFIDSLKFNTDKGIYLLPHDSIDTTRKPGTPQNLSCSPFYKIVTQILFLPPDHDEFYDDSTHNRYYHWSISGDNKKTDSLQLFYFNSTDYKNNTSFSLSTVLPHTHLFQGLHHPVLIFLCICLLIVVLSRIFYSTAKRVFLIHFFKDKTDPKNKSGYSADTKWLEQCYVYANLNKIKNLMALKKDEHFNFETLRIKELEMLKIEAGFEEFILQTHLALTEVYENIWEKCSEAEKFALFDFAADGFTNYKNVLVLYELYNKGLLIKEKDTGSGENDSIIFISMSFRNFLITKENDEIIKRLSKQNKHSSWGTLKTVFYIGLLAFVVFILITQQQTTQRLITILSSLGVLLPAILKLFDTASFSGKGARQDAK